jgi:hypothetical protein
VTARILAVVMLVAFTGSAIAQPPKAEKPDILKQLATRVTLEKGFDGKFKDAVTMLAEKYELPVVVDPHLGGGDVGVAAAVVVCDTPVDDTQVKLPKLTNVRLDTVVKLLAEQVRGKFLVYPDHVKIVPENFADYESGVLTVGTEAGEEQPLLVVQDLVRNKPLIKRALVNANFKNKPLSEILDEIAETTGANVTLSPLVAVQIRQAPITVRFANTPVDAAVRTLCEMTECGVIEDANVLLVTTRERAAARAKEDAQKLKDKQLPQQQAVGFGAVGLGGPLDAVTAVELVRLKEQNEQLKKQLEDVQKTLKKLTEK